MNDVFFAFGGEILAALALGFTAISTAVSVYGAISSASAQEDAADYNAAVEKNAAFTAQQQGEFDAQQIRNKGRKILAQQRAGYGASGVDPNAGSPLDVAQDTANQNEMEALVAIYTGKSGATAHLAQAKLDKMRGSAAVTAGYIGAGTSLLSGATSAVNIYRNPNFRN